MPFANCTEAANAGQFNIPRSSPDYSPRLDRDGDGVGCEKAGGSNSGPVRETNPGPVKETSTGTKVETGGGTGSTLPKTGPALELGIAGSAVLLLGITAALIFRRRKVRFQA